MSFGILTLATPNDYLKAIGLALSLRVSNPGIPIAVACSPRVRPLVAPHFDEVIDKDPALSGFMHKLYLDRYSPFEETFFFDSDVLVFRPLRDVLASWRRQPYAACGEYVTGGTSPFGLDRRLALQTIGEQRMVHIDGAGHAYFRKPECNAVFDQARQVATNYRAYGNIIRFADEDVMDIVMTMLQLKPMERFPFWSRHMSGKPGSVKMDATRGMCSLELAASGQQQYPYMMHFAAREVPFIYTKQLYKLFNAFDVDTTGLARLAVSDFITLRFWWPLKTLLRNSVFGPLKRFGGGATPRKAA